MYEVAEDSMLLSRWAKKLSRGNVLDVGTGSGILVLSALSSKKVKTVLGIDIDNEIIAHCKETVKDKRARFKHSEFFQAVVGLYDTILCNLYLPQEDGTKM